MKKKILVALMCACIASISIFPVVCSTEAATETTDELKEVKLEESVDEEPAEVKTNLTITCKMPAVLEGFEESIYVLYRGESTDFAVTLSKDNNFTEVQGIPSGEYEIIMTQPTGGDYRFMTPYNITVEGDEMNLYVYAMDGADFMNSDMYDVEVPENLAEYNIEYAEKLANPPTYDETEEPVSDEEIEKTPIMQDANEEQAPVQENAKAGFPVAIVVIAVIVVIAIAVGIVLFVKKKKK